MLGQVHLPPSKREKESLADLLPFIAVYFWVGSGRERKKGKAC